MQASACPKFVNSKLKTNGFPPCCGHDGTAWTDLVCVTWSWKTADHESRHEWIQPPNACHFSAVISCLFIELIIIIVVVFPRDLHVIPCQVRCDLYRWFIYMLWLHDPFQLSRQDQERRDWRKQLDEASLSRWCDFDRRISHINPWWYDWWSQLDIYWWTSTVFDNQPWLIFVNWWFYFKFTH